MDTRAVASAVVALGILTAGATAATMRAGEVASPTAVCTAEQKAKAVAALQAFTRTMAAKRRAYFRTHMSARQRAAFVKRQKATLARLRAAAGCDVPPEPPPVPPPLGGPGAPATYVFGPELSAADRALVQRALDAGARYYRSILGRELPPFTAWAYRNLDALVPAYAAAESRPADEARRLWGSGQVGHATLRKVWLGPAWFVAGRPLSDALKIGAHEAFHLLQYEIVGQRALGVSGLDEIPTAGPWWIAEGSAEYFAYLAVVRDGALDLADVRARWLRSTKATSATLSTLATLRGQRETPNAYDVYALAVELLLRDRDPKLIFAYYQALGGGAPWANTFAATFGRSYDAFVDEFEVYRRTL